MTTELIGAVLCGGESKRMGRDKGSLIKDGKSWACLMAEKAEACKIPAILSIHARQRALYGCFFPSHRLVTDAIPVTGPLNGLLSVHQRSPSSDILLLACDMLDMDITTLTEILRVREEQAPAEFYAYRVGQVLQPFCAIYTAGALERVYRLVLAEQLSGYSLQGLLKNGNTLILDGAREEAFKNYNRMEP